jgi:hypothetical protein
MLSFIAIPSNFHNLVPGRSEIKKNQEKRRGAPFPAASHLTSRLRAHAFETVYPCILMRE